MHGAKFERAGGDEEEGGLLVSFGVSLKIRSICHVSWTPAGF